MSGSRVPPPFSARTLEARLTPSHEARTLSMRLPWQELLAVEDAAKAAGKTRSEWLRERSTTNLTDVNGNPANAQVCAQAVDLIGSPISVRVGAGGTTTTQKVCTNAVAGTWSMNLPDTRLTSPINAGFNITAIDNVSGGDLIGPGYNYVQPTSDPSSKWCAAAGCDFGKLPPMNRPTLAALVQGPTGLTGPMGLTGATGPPLSVGATDGGAVVLPNSGSLLIDGASIAQGYGDSGITTYGSFAMLHPYLAGRYSYKNIAVAGSTLADITSRYTSTVQPLCQAATALHPAYYVPDSDAPYNSISTGALTAAQAASGYISLLQQAASDGCRPVASTIREIGNPSPTVASGTLAFNAALSRVRDLHRAAAGKRERPREAGQKREAGWLTVEVCVVVRRVNRLPGRGTVQVRDRNDADQLRPRQQDFRGLPWKSARTVNLRIVGPAAIPEPSPSCLRKRGKTIEAMRGIERWGASSMMERAFAGFGMVAVQAAAGEPEPNWWEVLGIDRKSSMDVVDVVCERPADAGVEAFLPRHGHAKRVGSCMFPPRRSPSCEGPFGAKSIGITSE